MAIGKLVAAIATSATLAAFVAAATPSATAQTTDAAVLALEQDGILAGSHCSTADCDGDLTRWEAALWFTSAVDLALEEEVEFDDVPAGGALADVVSALYNAGVTRGCVAEPLKYCPDRPTYRSEMASFLAAAFDLEAEDPGDFTDVNPDGVHARNIDAVWAAGLVEACGTEPLRYCPWEPIPRRQAALMLYRALRDGGDGSTTQTRSTSDTSSPGESGPSNTGPSNTGPRDTGPTNTGPTDPVRPTTPAVPRVCAVVDHINTTHDIDDHRGDPTEQAWALLADGRLFAHRHLPGGGALCWTWAPSIEGGDAPYPQNVPPPSHTH